MEQEMKYAISSKEMADKIWEDAFIKKYCDESTRETLVMKAIYIDTEDRILSNNNMTVRVRGESEHKFATLKWGGCSTNGFHERKEINIPVSDDSFIAPAADMFKDSEDGTVLLDLIGNKALLNLLEMRYLRRKARLNYKDSLVELAIDCGDIITDNGNVPILELELELLVGNTTDLKALGDEFIKQFELTPEDRSKFARGLAKLDE